MIAQFAQFSVFSPLTLVGEKKGKFMEIGSLVRVKREWAGKRLLSLKVRIWICIFLFCSLDPPTHYRLDILSFPRFAYQIYNEKKSLNGISGTGETQKLSFIAVLLSIPFNPPRTLHLAPFSLHDECNLNTSAIKKLNNFLFLRIFFHLFLRLPFSFDCAAKKKWKMFERRKKVPSARY